MKSDRASNRCYITARNGPDRGAGGQIGPRPRPMQRRRRATCTTTTVDWRKGGELNAQGSRSPVFETGAVTSRLALPYAKCKMQNAKCKMFIVSPRHLVSLSPCHLITPSPHHLVSLSPCLLVTRHSSLVTVSPCHGNGPPGRYRTRTSCSSHRRADFYATGGCWNR